LKKRESIYALEDARSEAGEGRGPGGETSVSKGDETPKEKRGQVCAGGGELGIGVMAFPREKKGGFLGARKRVQNTCAALTRKKGEKNGRRARSRERTREITLRPLEDKSREMGPGGEKFLGITAPPRLREPR